jgi:hypothetical protein
MTARRIDNDGRNTLSGFGQSNPSLPLPRSRLQERDLTLEALIDALAERVATKLCVALAQERATSIEARLLTVDQAATYMGRTEEAMQHMIAGGKVRTVRIDRRVFIDVRDLDKLIEDNKITGVR